MKSLTNELKELIHETKLHLIEQSGYIVADKDLFDALLLSSKPSFAKKTLPSQKPIPVKPLPPKEGPKSFTPQKAIPPPAFEPPPLLERKEDFSDVRKFFLSHYPNITLFKEPHVEEKREPLQKLKGEIVIGVLAQENTPFYQNLTRALDTAFNGAALIKKEEIPLYPALKVIVGVTIPIAPSALLQNEPQLKKELWRAIKLKMKEEPLKQV